MYHKRSDLRFSVRVRTELQIVLFWSENGDRPDDFGKALAKQT